ncbi:MAG TPA: ABC transporter ATP-binding protein [Burkholderiales bacterium]|nr:ABC transporter ATP-binding protein [Burkholderiales bacterium]
MNESPPTAVADSPQQRMQPASAQPNDVLLRVRDLRTALYTDTAVVRAIDGIDLDIRRGETFALVGESGCGKSMTALSIARLLPENGRVEGGSVELEGVDLLGLSEAHMRDVRGRRIAMIFQEPATSLNPVLTVGRQIEEVITRHTSLRGEAARRRIIELLDAVGIADSARRIDEYPFQLSGGMKQRVMIAVALAADPDLLIADEPTTALDVTIQAQVLELLKSLQRERGMAILLITHDLGVVSGVADRVAVMYAGQIVETAKRDDFFRAPQHPYSQKLFAALPTSAKRGDTLDMISGQVPPLSTQFVGCRFADRCPHAWDRCRNEAPGWTPIVAAHAVRCHLREKEPAPPRVADSGGAASFASDTVTTEGLLEVSDLRVHFPIRKGLFKRTVGHVKAVDGVSLRLAPGRTLALVGESGCGKTTVGKAILQLIRPTAGSIRFDGVELTALKGEALRRRRSDFQIVFQDPYASLNPRMRIGDILTEGINALGGASAKQTREARVSELLEQVGLPEDARYRYPHEFSGGQRQRVAIARALAVRPRLIVCDEPTSALDVSVQAQILNLLRGLQRDYGLAYLFITHNLAVVEYLADEVAVMYLGRIVERGTMEEVLGAPKHPYTRALLAAVPTIEGPREVLRAAGDLPSPVSPPSGCHFHPRCPHAWDKCREAYPDEFTLSDSAGVHCWLYELPSAREFARQAEELKRAMEGDDR